MKQHNFGNYDEDVIGSQSRLCGQGRGTGSGSLFCDMRLNGVLVVSSLVVACGFE